MRALLALILCLSPGAMFAWESTIPTLEVTSGTGHIGRSFEVLEDVHNDMRPEDVIRSHAFLRSEKAVPNLGVSRSAFWLRTRLVNRTGKDHLLLSVEHTEIEEVDVYTYVDGVLTQVGAMGQRRTNIGPKPVSPEFQAQLPVRNGDAMVVLIRVHSAKQLQVPVRIHTPETVAATGAMKVLLIGLYLGIMASLALYNLFIFLSTKDRGYLVYVTYILLVTLAQLSFWGVGQFHIWSGFPWFASKASIIFTFLNAIAASEFMKYFIRTKVNSVRLHNGIKYFYAAILVLLVLYLFVSPSLGYRLGQLTAGLFSTYLFITILHGYRNGVREAGYFLVAWSVFLLGVLLFTMKDMGILPYTYFTVYTMPLGSAIEGILLSFALADRINILRVEKERSQAEALSMARENERIIRDQNQTLELKVTERTQALQESNDHLKRTQVQLVEAEKMASLGQLTAGIAHEINNPLNFISSNIPPLKRDLADIVDTLAAYRRTRTEPESLPLAHELDRTMGLDETLEEMEAIIGSIDEGAARTSEIVRGLRTFSRLDEDDLKEADINEGLRSTLVVLGPQLKDGIRLELELGELPKVECYPGKLNQVFMNILTNAVQAARERFPHEGGRVRVCSQRIGDEAEISISDNGPGMPDAVKARIFEPFFTTKPVGEGTGLGLPIVHSIIEKHHGRIELGTNMGEGTTFTIRIPLRQENTKQANA